MERLFWPELGSCELEEAPEESGRGEDTAATAMGRLDLALAPKLVVRFDIDTTREQQQPV